MEILRRHDIDVAVDSIGSEGESACPIQGAIGQTLGRWRAPFVEVVNEDGRGLQHFYYVLSVSVSLGFMGYNSAMSACRPVILSAMKAPVLRRPIWKSTAQTLVE